MSFAPKRPGEEEWFSFDFSELLVEGQTVESAVWSVTVLNGRDANPLAMLFDQEIDGSFVRRLIGGGLNGTRYMLHCLATLSGSPSEEIELQDDVWVRNIG